MSYGYDIAELLADIKAKDEQIARLTPHNFTESEARLVLEAVRSAHTPERVAHEMRAEAASAVRKLQARVDAFEAERRADSEFVASLTQEERQLILDARAGRRRPG